MADEYQVSAEDVYVVVGNALRNPTSDTPQGAHLFTVDAIAIGVTWGQWQGASALSRAQVIGGPNTPTTDVRLELRGLIPGGLYQVYWSTLGPDSANPACPSVERNVSLGAFKSPSSNVFVADATGAATYHGRVEGALLDAIQVYFTVVYQFGGVAGDCENTYGHNSLRHVQILQKG
jgi:hypothetical protein